MRSPIRLLPLILILFIFTLLGLQRFGVRLAGGSGTARHIPAELVASTVDAPSTIRRGEEMATQDGFAQYEVLGTVVSLAPRTRLILDDSKTDRPNFTIIEGQITVDGPARISTRSTHLSVNGQAMITLYSWRNVIQALAIEGSVDIWDENEIDLEAPNGIELDTLEPFDASVPAKWEPTNTNVAPLWFWHQETRKNFSAS